MATVFIAGTAVVLPSRFAEGQCLDPLDAALLNQIWLKRLYTRLRRLLALGQLDAQSVEAKIAEMHTEDMTPYSLAQDADEDDPVLLEAIEIAKEIITQRMAQENMMPPKNLDNHAKALVEGMPAIVEQARMRVEARYQAAVALLGVPGAPVPGAPSAAPHTNGSV